MYAKLFFSQGVAKIMIAFQIAHHVLCILLENYYNNPCACPGTQDFQLDVFFSNIF